MVYLWCFCDVMLYVLINGSFVFGNEKLCKKNKKGGEDLLIISYIEKMCWYIVVDDRRLCVLIDFCSDLYYKVKWYFIVLVWIKCIWGWCLCIDIINIGL